MKRAQAGEARAFELLVERHQRAVIGYLLGMLGDREEALDAAQEVFVRVYTHAARMDPDSSFRAWVHRIATNVAIDALRRRKRWRWLLTGRAVARRGDADPADDLETSVPSGDADALEELLDRERAGIVHRALATLPPRYRSVLVLRDLQDLSYEEIAQALRCRTGTVKSRVNRARNLLREKLAAHVAPAVAPRNPRTA